MLRCVALSRPCQLIRASHLTVFPPLAPFRTFTNCSSGVSMLFSGFMPKKKSEERLKMKMSELIETVSKSKWGAGTLCGCEAR